MLDVFFEADEHLQTSRGRPLRPRDPDWLGPYTGHLVRTDPGSSVVAEDHGRLVAFGIVTVRGDSGFLADLFVRPRWQKLGLGRAVLAECLRDTGVRRMATCTDAVQPVSTGLYASAGLAPRSPIYLLSGTLEMTATPGLRSGIGMDSLVADEVASLDAGLLGYQRPLEHAAWPGLERSGQVFRNTSGELIGYGYTHPSGRIGPVAARDPSDLPAFVGHLARSIPGAEAHRCFVPGGADGVLRWLLAAGLRIDGSPSIYCSDHEGPDFARYLPMSPSLL